MLKSTPARGPTNRTFLGDFAPVYGAAHGFYFLEKLTMAIIDDRPQTGVAIGTLDEGTFFLSRGTLYFKVESNVVIDLQHGRRISFEPRTCVQPVTVDIFIRSNKG
jgi:hypothetical protein